MRNLGSMKTALRVKTSRRKPDGPRRLRIVHLPTSTGGYSFGLSTAERRIGLESSVVVFNPTQFEYGSDLVLFEKRDGTLMRILRRIGFLLSSMMRYDAFHFNFGSSFFQYKKDFVTSKGKWFSFSAFIDSVLQYKDLWLLKMLKKVIIFTFQGDDARQVDYCRRNYAIHYAHHIENEKDSRISDFFKRKHIKKIDGFADMIYYLNPDLGNVLPARSVFTPYGHIDFTALEPSWIHPVGDLRFFHAPSDRAVKGTAQVLEVVKKLKEKGLKFEFQLVEGKTNTKALEIYRTCDILVDQLFAGWYGGLAVEAMALGKPVICYIREKDLRFLPPGMRESLPIIRATGETLPDVMEKLIALDRSELLDIAKKSYAFARKWHGSAANARDMKEVYQGLIREKGFSVQGRIPAGLELR